MEASLLHSYVYSKYSYFTLFGFKSICISSLILRTNKRSSNIRKITKQGVKLTECLWNVEWMHEWMIVDRVCVILCTWWILPFHWTPFEHLPQLIPGVPEEKVWFREPFAPNDLFCWTNCRFAELVQFWVFREKRLYLWNFSTLLKVSVFWIISRHHSGLVETKL